MAALSNPHLLLLARSLFLGLGLGGFGFRDLGLNDFLFH
jgi:hypothetical protein